MKTKRSPLRLFTPLNAALFFVILFPAYLLLNTAVTMGEWTRTVFGDLFSPAIGLLAAAALFWGARRSAVYSRRLFIAWGLLALAQIAIALGDVGWFVQEVVLRRTPLPSAISDVFYLLYFALSIWGILSLPVKRLTTNEWLKVSLDLSIVVLAAVLIFWYFWISPLLKMGGMDRLTVMFSVVYPVLHLFLIIILFLFLSRRLETQVRGPIWLLTASITLQIITDAIYGYQVNAGTYLTEVYVNVGWSAAILVAGLAGVLQANAVKDAGSGAHNRTNAIQPARVTAPWIVYVPYVWLGAAYLLLSASYGRELPVRFSTLLIWVGVVIGLVVIRQIVSLDENTRLLARQRLIDDARRQSEEKYRTVVDNASEFILVAQDEKVKFLNRKAGDLSGYSEEELLSKPFIEFIHPDDRKILTTRYLKRLRGGDLSYPFAFRTYSTDGSIRWNEVRSTLVTWEGRPAVLSFLNDITERKAAEEALKESEERYRDLIENIEDVIYIVDGSGKIKYINKAIEKASGYSKNELLKKKFTDFLMPDSLQFVKETFKRQLAGEDLGTFELRFRSKNGEVVILETRERFVFDGDRVAEVHGLGRNATERRKIVNALQESEEKFRNLFETARDFMYICTVDGEIIDINESGKTFFGYTEDEIKKMNIRDFYAEPKERDSFVREVMERGFIEDYPVKLIKGDGTLVDAVVTVTLRKDRDGKIIGLQGSVRDITERKKMEEQLFAAQKMEAIGRLTGGIAHDFNNILATILGYASLLKNKYSQGDMLSEGLDAIEKSALRASKLTSQLLAYSRKGKLEKRSININHILDEIYDLISKTFEKSIKIEVMKDESLPTIEGDASQINQVLMNLVINARDAMPEGGTLQIRTFMEEISEGIEKSNYTIQPGRYVSVRVADAGTGIDRDTLGHIFEPYFTTKRDKGGTGLGLSVVYGIVKGHGGYIDVNSEVGKGTEFLIYLPASERQEERIPERVREIRGGSETILVIDDEEDILSMVGAVLSGAGYKVIRARSGAEGIAFFKKRKQPIGLVILDIMMPEMGGGAVLEKVLSIDPAAKVLLASGFSEENQHHDLLQKGALGFIGKPFTAHDLLIKVREVLG